MEARIQSDMMGEILIAAVRCAWIVVIVQGKSLKCCAWLWTIAYYT